MSEVALYRKYRPEKFKDVVGQEHVTSVLEGAIKNDKVAHAYLFSGSRGIGKTSIARIFARELGTDWKDIYEIDGASNRGIDEIRELREAVHTLPFESKYKVYIIDEVHMLTTAAFNALLKTLEEPPEHVIFMLATTEKHKLLDTIISRCQTFDLKRPNEDDLAKAIKKISDKEGYKIDKESVSLISMLGEGSFRDAIGTLQKLVSISKDKTLSIDEVRQITHAPDTSLVIDAIGAFLSSDSAKFISILNKVKESNSDIKTFTKLLIKMTRFLMLIIHAPELKDEIKKDISEDNLKRLEEFSKKDGTGKLSIFLGRLISAYEQIDKSYIETLPLELAVLESIEPRS